MSHLALPLAVAAIVVVACLALPASAEEQEVPDADVGTVTKSDLERASSNQPAKLSRPLDFVVVADDSDARVSSRRWWRRSRGGADQIKGSQGAEATFDILQSSGAGKLPKGFPAPGT